MDALLAQPLRSTCPAISRHNVCCQSDTRPDETGRVTLRSSYSRVQIGLTASFRVDYGKQFRSRKGRRSGVITAELATADPVNDDFSPTKSDDVARGLAILKTAANTRKVPASEICEAFQILDKEKIDPKNFPSIIGGTKSPGRTWMLIFSSSKDEYKRAEGGGNYFPVTAVQNFDAEASRIENGVFLGPLGSLSLAGNYVFDKRKLAFYFHTLNLTFGSFGPIRIGLGSKDREVTKDDAFFIWYYADDEIIVAKGRSGGIAFWVRCTNVKKSLF